MAERWIRVLYLHTEVRFTAGDAARARKYAEELLAIAPDILVTTGSLSLRAGHQDVAIQDGTGKSVSGDLLMACCRGEKELTPDLFS